MKNYRPISYTFEIYPDMQVRIVPTKEGWAIELGGGLLQYSMMLIF